MRCCSEKKCAVRPLQLWNQRIGRCLWWLYFRAGRSVAVSSNEWETGCSLSKARADSDTPTRVPQITQQCYLPEDTIKETHQSRVSREALPHAQASNTFAHKHIHRISH